MESLLAKALNNWEILLAGFYLVEKIVKVSPSKYDDILVDGIKAMLTAAKAKKTIEDIKK